MNFNFSNTQALQIQQPWITKLKRKLIQKNHLFLTKHPPRHLIFDKHLWSSLEQAHQIAQTHNYTLQESSHGHYSQYVPITRNQPPVCQLSQCFLYLRYLKEKKSTQYELELFKISTEIEDSDCFKKWQQLCHAYVPAMPVEQMFEYYHLLLANGTQKLKMISQLKFPLCREDVILVKILEIKKFMERSDGINAMITVSLEKGQEVTLENLSKTMKNLFCPICLVYDCLRHLIPSNLIENNFQYVRNQSIRKHLQMKKTTAVNLLQKFISIIQGQNNVFDSTCSQLCFQNLSVERWKMLNQLRQKQLFSPIFCSIVKMGVEMYNYSPCHIRILLQNTLIMQRDKKQKDKAIQCQTIFYYLIRDYNLLKKMQNKFYESENIHLSNQVKNYFVQTNYQQKKLSRKKKCGKNKQIANFQHDEYNSVCYHFFLDQQPTDLECLYCDCRKRGYCLPECLCSQQCQIQLKGCRCKGENTCWDNKCICFKSNQVCTPAACQYCCCCSENPKKNLCQNNQIALNSNKLTRVGVSTIPKAGFGLFAGEFISKGIFVIKYLGQLVDSQSLQKFRENLVKDNLFYTFKLKQYESIDSRMYGNKARFINHSKQKQNVCPMRVRIQEEDIIIFYAIKDIRENQQLFFNYNGQGQLSYFRDKYPFID